MEKSNPAGWLGWNHFPDKGSDNQKPLANELLAHRPVFPLLFAWLGLCHCSAPTNTTSTKTPLYKYYLSRYLFISFTQHFTVSLIIAELPKACFIASTIPGICHHAHIYSWINTEGGKERERRPRVLFYQVWGISPTAFISPINM